MTTPRRIEPWAIGIPVFLALFALALVVFAVWSTGHDDALVADDYYAQSERYQERIDERRRAQAFDAFGLHVDRAAQRIELAFGDAAAAGTVIFYRPSDAELDRTVVIAPDAEGRQTIEMDTLAPGLWTVRIAWSAGGEALYHEEQILVDG